MKSEISLTSICFIRDPRISDVVWRLQYERIHLSSFDARNKIE